MSGDIVLQFMTNEGPEGRPPTVIRLRERRYSGLDPLDAVNEVLGRYAEGREKVVHFRIFYLDTEGLPMEGEQPPRKPGTPRENFDDHAWARGSVWVSVRGPAPGDADPQALALLCTEARDALEALWEQIDPRTGRADRFRAAGCDPELLGLFYGRAAGILEVLGEMVEELEAAGGPHAAPLPGTLPARAQLAVPYGDTDVALKAMIDIMAEAGVEVDETDVLGWTVEQRAEACRYADHVHARARTGQDTDPGRKPAFLP